MGRWRRQATRQTEISRLFVYESRTVQDCYATVADRIVATAYYYHHNRKEQEVKAARAVYVGLTASWKLQLTMGSKERIATCVATIGTRSVTSKDRGRRKCCRSCTRKRILAIRPVVLCAVVVALFASAAQGAYDDYYAAYDDAYAANKNYNRYKCEVCKCKKYVNITQ